VSRSRTVRLRVALEVFQNHPGLSRLAPLQQQRGALGEARGNQPWPAAAFPQRLGLAQQQGRKVTLLALFGDAREDDVCPQGGFNRPPCVDHSKPLAQERVSQIETALLIKHLGGDTCRNRRETSGFLRCGLRNVQPVQRQPLGRRQAQMVKRARTISWRRAAESTVGGFLR
jgi:hypothetical protein